MTKLAANSRLAIVLFVMLVIVLGFWWWMLSDYRAMTVEVARLQQAVDTMQRHIAESERVLTAVSRLEMEVRGARMESDRALEAAEGLDGDDFYDALDELLYEDRARRDNIGATCPIDGTLH